MIDTAESSARWSRRSRTRQVLAPVQTTSDVVAPATPEDGSSKPSTSGAQSENCASKTGMRWRRDPKSGYATHALALPYEPQNTAGCEDVAATAAMQGLCPRSKLSFANPAMLLQDPASARDFASVLAGGAHHLKRVFCEPDDRSLFQKLKSEIEDTNLWRTREGLRFKDSYEKTIAPEGGQRTTGRITGEDAITLEKLPTHKFVLEHLMTLFDAKLLSWWINLYPSGRDAKNFHKDNFGQNITIGASFGATRNLTFRHTETRQEFHFPQVNGDVFAFREDVNNTFLHGMYPLKDTEADPGPRISVIMMGRANQ